MRRFAWIWMGAFSALAGGACGGEGGEHVGAADQGVTGAAYTTFDVTAQGCLDSPNGVDCNRYAAKRDVYVSGGPARAGLGDGDYYFAVLVPGSQNGGFIDGATGNLSSPFDASANRTFTVLDHEIASYPGTHDSGTSPNGKYILDLAPFANTTNPGGVYILAVCTVGATKPSDCKFDAFKAPPDREVPDDGGHPCDCSSWDASAGDLQPAPFVIGQ